MKNARHTNEFRLEIVTLSSFLSFSFHGDSLDAMSSFSTGTRHTVCKLLYFDVELAYSKLYAVSSSIGMTLLASFPEWLRRIVAAREAIRWPGHEHQQIFGLSLMVIEPLLAVAMEWRGRKRQAIGLRTREGQEIR